MSDVAAPRQAWAARLDWRRLLPRILAPVGALLLAALISSIALVISNKDPLAAFSAMIDYGSQPESMVDILNKSTDYYIAAVAVAIGFRMNLFNIGVDGQYRLASMVAASVGAAPFLHAVPGILRILLIVVIAMAVGAFWAGVAAVLKITRGVSEVISTIMLNFIGGQIVAYLLTTNRLGVQARGSNDVTTPLLPKDSWVSGIPLIPGAQSDVKGFVVVAVLVGVAYWFVLGRTRFGFDLRASGQNATSAVASGINAKRMVLYAMLLSGAVAGLVGMSELLGTRHQHTSSVGGLGITAIGIALLGRNSPVGIALAALLWAFLDRSALILDLNEIPKEIVTIMQGTTVLAVVVAYELAGRFSRRAQQRRAGTTVSEPDSQAPADRSEAPA
jgi:simple sugar transport system permease protein